jgi:hypothetical protein
VLLNETDCTGCARPLLERQAHTDAHDLFMRTT